MNRLGLILVLGSLAWSDLWVTREQQAQRLMSRGEFQAAAEAFQDPMRKGVAWFRAGEFQKAEQTFARIPSAEAEFNRGNCLVMQGKYLSAVERYDRALELRPNWEDAELNREIASARAKALEQQGGEMGDQKIGADEIRFDKSSPSGGKETQTEGGQPLSDAAMQSLWLRRVQTKPADFLKSKFAFQAAASDAESNPK